MIILVHFFNSAEFAVMITLLLYWASLHVHGRYSWANPLVCASITLVMLLYMLHVPYSHYSAGGDLFKYLLGPATVALGVPMYKQAQKLKGSLRPLFLVVLAGSIVGMATAAVVAWLFGAPREVIVSAIPKSVTMPIALEASKELHGDPRITAALVLISGLIGSIVGPEVLRLASILHEHAVGSAIGTSSHALGTATLIRRSEVQGSVSSLAMAMAGVITAVLCSVLTFWLH